MTDRPRRRRSLSVTLAVAASLGLLLPAMLVGGVLLGVREPQEAREQLQRDLDVRLDVLAASLPELLWNLDSVAISALVQAMARTPEVALVRVSDNSQAQTVAELVLPERRQGDVIAGERDILRQGQRIGRLRIEFDDHALKADLARQRTVYLATVGGQMLISLALVLWALNARVMQPLRRLGTFAREISRGRFDAAEVPRSRAAEIDELGQGLEHMRVALRDQFASQAELLARLEGLADTVPGVVFQLERAQDGVLRFHYVSEAAGVHLGVSADALLGDAERFFGALHAGDRAAVMSALERSASQGLPWQQEFRAAPAAAGQADRWLYANAIAERAARAAVLWHGFITDISRQRRDTQELEDHRHHLSELVEARTLALERATQAAQAANQAKTAFLANMSHEIRTPLNAISGLTYLMRRESRDLRLSGQLDKVSGAAEHLLAVVNQVLDLSKIEAGKLQLEPEAFTLDTMLETVTTVLGPKAADKQLAFRVEIEPALRARALYGDSQRIAEVLINFAGNAIKFTDRGEVTLSVLRRGASPGTLNLRFEVRDTGIGIDPQDLPRLFQEFEQADVSTTRRYGGTGLGLVISRRLAELMRGEVGVRSTPGQGSTFWLDVPLQKVGSADAGTAARLTEAGSFEGLRVLLVEDNPVNVEVAVAMLEGLDLEVDVARNGSEALASADPQRHALVLMDVQMPVMDGLAATRELRRKGWTRPILAMTANAFDEERDRCLQAGMDDHIAKPVVAAHLQATLRRWLNPNRSQFGAL